MDITTYKTIQMSFSESLARMNSLNPSFHDCLTQVYVSNYSFNMDL